MARYRQVWQLEYAGVGTSVRKVGPATWEYFVIEHFRLTRDNDRMLEVLLTPDKARELAESLMRFADQTDKLNS